MKPKDLLTYVKAGSRILFILIVGIGLIYGALKGKNLLNDYQDALDDQKLLSQDLAVARHQNKAALTKIKKLTVQYQEELNKNKQYILSYAELEAKYKVTKKELKKIKSESNGIIIINDGQTDTQEFDDKQKECLDLLKGENIFFKYKDERLDVAIHSIRTNKRNWHSTLTYTLTQQFKLELIQTKKDNGVLDFYVKLYEIDENKNPIRPLKIEDFKLISKTDYSYGFDWWNPQLKLGLHQPFFSQRGWIPLPYLGVSFMSYTFPGKEQYELNFAQLNVAVGGDNYILFGLVPVSYNIGKHIPLLEDLWIGPEIGTDVKGNISIGLNIGTNL